MDRTRVIKFRGKRTGDKEWAAGHYLTKRDNDGLHHMISVQDMWAFYEVYPETIGQCVYEGLWEGDVVEGKECGEFGTILSSWQGVVYWDEDSGAFKIMDLTEGDSYPVDDYDFDKVIGNIHDNLEFKTLMEVHNG